MTVRILRMKNCVLASLLQGNHFVFEDHQLGSDKEGIAIKAEFRPLVIETMTKFKDKQEVGLQCLKIVTSYYELLSLLAESLINIEHALCSLVVFSFPSPSSASFSLPLLQFLFGSPEQMLPGLLKWKEPNCPVHIYGAANFKVFLPPSEDWPQGVPYHVVTPNPDSPRDHSNRYHPPRPEERERLLYALLSQFHPNPFLQMRFGPRGTFAMVRAQNQDYLDVVIRYCVYVEGSPQFISLSA